MSLSRWCPLSLGPDGLSRSAGVADWGWQDGSLARDRALAMVSSSRAIWQRWDSKSGFFGLGGGGFEVTGIGELPLLDDPLCLMPIEGRVGAGRLFEDWCCLVITASGMLFGLAVAAGGPGGGGAGRRRGIERGGGGRGGRDLLLGLILSTCGSLLWLPVKGFDSSAFSRVDSTAFEGGSSSELLRRCGWVWRKSGLTKHRGPLECLLSRWKLGGGAWDCKVAGALSQWALVCLCCDPSTSLFLLVRWGLRVRLRGRQGRGEVCRWLHRAESQKPVTHRRKETVRGKHWPASPETSQNSHRE